MHIEEAEYSIQDVAFYNLSKWLLGSSLELHKNSIWER